MIHAVVKALNISYDDFPINKSSIHIIGTQSRKDRAESIKSDFENNLAETVTVHWDGKLLPGLDCGLLKFFYLDTAWIQKMKRNKGSQS
ncbi:hypothetical protein QE152_g8402 [Popillia japonica]|uniref:Uncharacterized protein n=1 Tax=Popillia japonica TaxID=7064 RepID=A0AAW1MBT1_POPJA